LFYKGIWVKYSKNNGHKKDPVPFFARKRDRLRITVLGVFVKKITGFSNGCFFKKNLQVLSAFGV